MKKINTKFPLVDLGKFVMSILVMTIHIPLGIAELTNNVISNSIARIAVPFFFISSGYFFFKNKELDKKSLYLILKRIGILTVGWYSIYKIYDIVTYLKSGGEFSHIIENIGWQFGHLWFLPALMIGLILSYVIKKYCNNTTGIILVTSCLLIGIMGDAYLNLVKQFHLPRVFFYYYFKITSNTRNGFFFAFPLLMISSWIPFKKIKNILPFLIIGFVFILIEFGIIYKCGLGRDYNVYFSIIIFAVLLFQFCITTNIKMKSSISLFFRKYSMGIYFLHMLIYKVISTNFQSYHFILSLLGCIFVIYIFRLLNNKYTNYLFD